jgi:hypothetical protein
VAGFIVNAGADDDVVLRGLDIHGGAAASACGYGGTQGVRVLGARSVRIEDSSIAASDTAVRVAPGSSAPDVVLNRVDIGNHCTAGVDVAPGDGASADVTVRDSTVTNAGVAVRVADRGRVRLTDSLITGNAFGLQTLGGGIIEAFTDTRVFGNGVDGTPTLVPDAPPAPVPGPAGPAGPAGLAATGPAGPAGPAGRRASRRPGSWSPPYRSGCRRVPGRACASRTCPPPAADHAAVEGPDRPSPPVRASRSPGATRSSAGRTRGGPQGRCRGRLRRRVSAPPLDW